MAEGMENLFGTTALFDVYDINPWWERLSEYSLAAMGIASISLSYVCSTTGKTNCLPSEQRNIVEGFSTLQAKFINDYCGDKFPWYVGLISVVCTMLLFVSHYWWFSVPKVKQAFQVFIKANKNSANLLASTPEMKRLILEPIHPRLSRKERKKKSKYRQICRSLWMYKGQVFLFYNVRCLVSFMTSLGFLIYYIRFATTQRVDSLYDCNLLEEDVTHIPFTLSDYNRFRCSFEFSRLVFSYLRIFMICLAVQMLFVAFGYCFVLYNLFQSGLWKEKGRLMSPKLKSSCYFANLMLTWWENANPAGGKRVFRDIVRLIFSSHALDIMLANIKDAVLYRDYEYIELFTKLHVDGCQCVIEVLYDLCESKNVETDAVTETLDHMKFYEWTENALRLANLMARNKHWQVLVKLLNVKEKSRNTDDDACGITTFDFDQLEYDNAGRSTGRNLLFYALTYSPKVWNIPNSDFLLENKSTFASSAARYLLSHAHENLYVHFDGRSLPPDSFVNAEAEADGSYPTLIKAELLDLIASTVVSQRRTLSQTALEQLFEEYQRWSDEDAWNENLENVAHQLCGMKFRFWNETSKEFARRSARKKHWQIFVSLLNAKIEPNADNEQLDHQDCGVTDINELETDYAGNSICYYAFESQNRPTPFVYTAAKHILWCNRGHNPIKVVCRSQTKHLEEFVHARFPGIYHEERIKETLLRLLEKSQNFIENETADSIGQSADVDQNDFLNADDDIDTVIEMESSV